MRFYIYFFCPVSVFSYIHIRSLTHTVKWMNEIKKICIKTLYRCLSVIITRTKKTSGVKLIRIISFVSLFVWTGVPLVQHYPIHSNEIDERSQHRFRLFVFVCFIFRYSVLVSHSFASRWIAVVEVVVVAESTQACVWLCKYRCRIYCSWLFVCIYRVDSARRQQRSFTFPRSTTFYVSHSWTFHTVCACVCVKFRWIPSILLLCLTKRTKHAYQNQICVFIYIFSFGF